MESIERINVLSDRVDNSVELIVRLALPLKPSQNHLS